MPAAAVIPAPIAYIKVVAVKKLVVGFLVLFSMVRREVSTVGGDLLLEGVLCS